MSAAVVVEGLTRRFGNLEAVSDLSFEIPAGQVLGFIGANGAGKTTTMRMLATLEPADAGRVVLCGYDAALSPAEVRRRIGYMPDGYGTYAHMTVFEYLDFYARAYGFTGDERKRRTREVMEFTELGELAEREMSVLSKGMSQRLCLARALLHDPEVLILDEPAAGLDPKARIEFKQLVRLLAQDGKTLFISSHILTELEEMCDAMLFIDAGRVVHHGTAASLKSTGAAAVVAVQVSGDPERVREWALMTPGVVPLEALASGYRLQLDPARPEDLALALRRMVEAGLAVVDFHREERRLEDAFVEVLRKIEEAE